MATNKKVIKPSEEVIEQLHNDFTNNTVRIYKTDCDKVPATFIQPNLIHPDVFKKSQFVAVGVSACAAEGRQYMYLAAGRIDQEEGRMVTDLDPIVMVYDLQSGTPAPSGVTCFHADFDGRTTEFKSQVLDTPISGLKEDMQGDEIPFKDAPKRFTEAMHHSAKVYRETFDKEKRNDVIEQIAESTKNDEALEPGTKLIDTIDKALNKEGEMAERDKIPSIAPLHYKYPLIAAGDIPPVEEEVLEEKGIKVVPSTKFILFPISFRTEEIKAFEVLFFHRLLKRNYGYPSSIEFKEITRETQEYENLGHIKATGIGKEWKYYVRTPSGGIIRIGTEKLHSVLKIFYVLPEGVSDPNEKQIKEGEKFVSDLLTEATRLRGQILNPRKEFEEGEGTQLYLLDNVFRRYYGSADLMLEDADEYEDTNFDECQKYLQSIYDMEEDSEKTALIDKYLAGLGMFYRSIIIHYFMAFEGFVNLLYHSFGKKELKQLKDPPWEQRMDIEMKVLLMPGLCNGFKNEMVSPDAEIFKNFKQLKNYRNEIFHSKIVDSLKHVAFVQDGFFYTIHMEKEKKASLFPPAGKTLEKEDVLKVKSLVDNLIEEIVNNMNEESSELVKEFILTGLTVPFWKDDTGEIRFGKSGIDNSGSIQ
jgi:hypothetical protein